jgi:hypothetical protein
LRETLVSAPLGRQYASLLAKAATPLAGGRKQLLIAQGAHAVQTVIGFSFVAVRE